MSIEQEQLGIEPDTFVDSLKNVCLNDDSLLETVHFTQYRNNETSISSFSAAFVLAKSAYTYSAEHRDELTIERCMAFVEKVDFSIYVYFFSSLIL